MNEELRRQFNKKLDNLIDNHKNRYLLEGIELHSIQDIYFYLEYIGVKLSYYIEDDILMGINFPTVIRIENLEYIFENETFIDIKIENFNPSTGNKCIRLRSKVDSCLNKNIRENYIIDFIDDSMGKESYLNSNQLINEIRKIEKEVDVKYLPKNNYDLS